ncbi:hypothetical protein V8I69_003895 [Salmonella enterica]
MADKNEAKSSTEPLKIYKTLKMDSQLIGPLLRGEKYVTRRKTAVTYHRSNAEPGIWHYWKLFSISDHIDTIEGETYRIPAGAELFVSSPEQKIIKNAPIQAGDRVLFLEVLPDGVSRNVATATASRVRIEHIQDITEAEALFEGFGSREDFRLFMDSIYPGYWNHNGSVWVYELEDIQEVQR